MTSVETLPTKQKHLIGIGAAIAAGCEPCTKSFVTAAREAGACPRGVRFAIESGLAARASATVTMNAFADSTFQRPELDAAFREERALLGALIDVAAAMAGNAAALLKSRVDAARTLGATDEQLRLAAQIGRTAKRGAEGQTEATFDAQFEGPGDTSSCCAGEISACGAGGAQARPCACGSPDSSEASACGAGGAQARPCACGSPDSSEASEAIGACGCGAQAEPDAETVRIEKTKSSCSLCEDYARIHENKQTVVMSCEGACLRGEISRQAANQLCHDLAPDKTVRLCLGGAFTKDAGQRRLVRNAERVVALEGCPIRCASRMMRGHFADLKPEVFVTDGMCEFDRSLFGLDALPPEEVRHLGLQVAAKVAERI